MNLRTVAPLAFLLLLPLAGCQVVHDTALADAESDCERRVSQSQVQECKQRIRDQESAYERERAKSDGLGKKPRTDDLCYVKKSTGERVCPN
jgi:hypothetical protein